MKCTLQEAAKLLRTLNDQLTASRSLEEQQRSFVAATVENVEDVRPAYDYRKTAAEQEAIRQKIRTVKHAINVCNTVTAVPGFDMTIDQLLILIPQLTAEKNKLYTMMDRLPRQRVQGYSKANLIEYDYANYDIEAVRADYDAVARRLISAQTTLDHLNSTVTLEIDV